MDVNYLVVGGGMTADAAVKALRKADPAGKVLMVGQEDAAPYKRPPLSKGMWGPGDPPRTDLRTADSGAELLLGDEVVSLDVEGRSATLKSATRIGFDRVLLATGARARMLPNLEGVENVVAYRTVADYERVRRAAQPGARAVVVGGGFIGSEMAAALTKSGMKVSMVFPEESVGGGRFPPSVARIVDADYKARGVEIHGSSAVESARNRGSAVILSLKGGAELETDLVIVGVGAVPNDELARAAGLRTDNGVVVDSHLRAFNEAGVVPHVFAAGDVASFEWPALGRRLRIEHEDNAYGMGAYAGRYMAGGTQAAYGHLPFFYSDLFDNGYEAVGLIDPRLHVVEDWRVPDKEGVVYFLQEGLVRGALLWNTWGQVDAARDLIEGGVRHEPADLMGRIPADD